MALRSAAYRPNSLSQTASRSRPFSLALALLWAGFVTLVIAGPWLLPGYIFGTDWPGPRHFAFPGSLESSALLRGGLFAVGWAVGGEAAGKALVLGLLFTAAALSYASLPTGGFVPRASAAAIYVVNPFVYGRLHYGQLFLLGAYAVFPWAASRFRLLLKEPSWATALVAAVAVAVTGIFSPHVLLIAGLLAASLLLARVEMTEKKLDYLKRTAPLVLLTVGTTIVVSAYWLVPLVIGRGPEASVIAGTGAGDVSAYAAVPDHSLGLVPNLLGLYGFWAEDSGRFASMKAFVLLWPIVLLLLLLVAAIGASTNLVDRSSNLSAWVAGLLVAGTVALLLEIGISHPTTAPLVTWLDAHVPIYRGMRDAGKWAVLLALVYSQLIGLGAAAILAALNRGAHDPLRSDWIPGIAAGLLLALPLYYGNGLLFGAHGEIRPSPYPAGWYSADNVLATDSHPGRALFLPWHGYMSYSFVRNQNRVIAPPAPSFFSVPVVVSTNPEVPGVTPPRGSDQDALARLVQAGSTGQWARELTALNIKYVLLARELDWTYFKFLDDQPGLTRVGDFGSIVLYRNDLVP